MPSAKTTAPERYCPEPGTFCWAMILAGGSGERLRRDEAKAFVTVAGRPLLAWSLLSFARHPAITDILVVVPNGTQPDFHAHVLGPLKTDLDGSGTRIHEPIIGGEQRQDSARAGLARIISLTKADNIEETPVLIHDAARPIVRSRVIDELLARLQSAHRREPGVAAVIPALPVADTLKRIRTGGEGESGAYGHVERTVSREGIYQIQTPQVFHLGSILEAHQEAVLANYQATDDAKLFELMNWPVEIVPGSRLSLKVTYPEDLALIEGWLNRSAPACGKSDETRETGSRRCL